MFLVLSHQLFVRQGPDYTVVSALLPDIPSDRREIQNFPKFLAPILVRVGPRGGLLPTPYLDPTPSCPFHTAI
jgi:hypothetical protein